MQNGTKDANPSEKVFSQQSNTVLPVQTSSAVKFQLIQTGLQDGDPFLLEMCFSQKFWPTMEPCSAYTPRPGPSHTLGSCASELERAVPPPENTFPKTKWNQQQCLHLLTQRERVRTSHPRLRNKGLNQIQLFSGFPGLETRRRETEPGWGWGVAAVSDSLPFLKLSQTTISLNMCLQWAITSMSSYFPFLEM